MLDNWNTEIGGNTLAQLLSQDGLGLRPLGGSVKHSIPNRFTTVINGNNPELAAREFIRRILHNRLDANSETPWLVEHASKPKETLMTARGEFVALAMTVIRYGIQNNLKRNGCYENYDAWDRMVRAPIIDLGYADPIASQQTLSVETENLQQLAEFLPAFRDQLIASHPWHKPYYYAGEIIAAAQEFCAGQAMRPKLNEALMAIDADDDGLRVPSAIGLGKWLKKHAGKMVGQLKLVLQYNDTLKRNEYSVEEMKVNTP
jgi:putative DNA primase/helicase